MLLFLLSWNGNRWTESLHFLETLFSLVKCWVPCLTESIRRLKGTHHHYETLQCLKLGLDVRSIQLLQPLYEEYEKWQMEDESTERDEKLKLLDEELTHGSLGIEHFFREVAIMFENIVATKEEQSTGMLMISLTCWQISQLMF